MFEMTRDPFFQRALLATLFAGVACSTVGVLVVTMRISFLGVCMSHAAFAGALLGLVVGLNPTACAVLMSIAAAGVLGPLADRGDFSPDTAIGIVFSSAMGVSFLLLSMIPGPKTEALGLLWGSVLTVSSGNLYLLGAVAAGSALLATLFFRQIQTVIFSRDLARSLGLPATAVFYGILIASGLTTTASLNAIGGLLVFTLMVNPAAAAYQLTYSLKRMFVISAVFGVASGWLGLVISWYLDLPTGAVIVVTSCGVFVLASTFSPKRRALRGRSSAPESSSGQVQGQITPHQRKIVRAASMNSQAEFFDSYADRWDSMEREEVLSRLERVVRESQTRPGMEILDVGTGTGVIIPYLVRAIGASGRILAIDISEGMLRVAKAKSFPDNVEFRLADIEEFTCPDCSYDRVICNAVFPHFVNKDRVLRLIYRMLCPGGILVISHPTGREAVNKIHREAGSVVTEDRVHQPQVMQEMLETARFTDVQVTDEPDFYMATGMKPA